MIKKIVILKPKSSLNFSESINVGVKASNSKYIFIANDDIILSKHTLEELVKNTNDTTIVGPDSNCNVGFQTDFAYSLWIRGTPDYLKLVPGMTLDQIKDYIPLLYELKPSCSMRTGSNYKSTDLITREWVAYFATMFTRQCFMDVGFLDEKFVYDKEDLDHCVRAARIGKKFLTVFSSYCFHFGGISRKRKHAELGLKHEEDTLKNEAYFKEKWGT